MNGLRVIVTLALLPIEAFARGGYCAARCGPGATFVIGALLLCGICSALTWIGARHREWAHQAKWFFIDLWQAIKKALGHK